MHAFDNFKSKSTSQEVSCKFIDNRKFWRSPLNKVNTTRFELINLMIGLVNISHLLSPFDGPKEAALAFVSFDNKITINLNNMKRA